LTREERHGPAGVPHENGPSPLPARHDNLRDNIVVRMFRAQFENPVDRVAESCEFAAQPLPRTRGLQVSLRVCAFAVDQEYRDLVRAEAVKPCDPVDAVGQDEPVPEPGVQEPVRSR